MSVKLTWVNNSVGHDGTRIYMGSDSATELIASLPPGAQEYIVQFPEIPNACFAVEDFSDQSSMRSAEVCAETLAPTDWSAISVGDYVEGGIYAGIDTIAGVDYHIISGDAASEAISLQWKTTTSFTEGAGSETDGLANTQAMIDAGISDHPAAQHCINYTGGGRTDWHMPAKSQVTLMYNNLRLHPEFDDSRTAATSGPALTWASTQTGNSWAYVRRFSDGVEASNIPKTNTNTRTRPIRRVPV